ncbi:MAG: methylenetetrahydrofolate reductase [Pseudomonadota bacterium]
MAAIQISCEFFPPRDEPGREKLVSNVAAKLGELGPEFFSVTYGAGGSTRDGTLQTVKSLLQTGHQAVPHLSIGNDDQAELLELLDEYRASGVRHIVALRGDQPSGMGANRFTHNAEALVRLVREHSGDHFHLIVAAYPEVHPDAKSAQQDLEFFQRKVDAGANSAITQYFYCPEAYAVFVERCAKAGLNIPIYPGIMPITNAESLFRFSEKAGADIPRWLQYGMADQETEQDLAKFGVDVVTRLCERLIELGAPGLHFYTLNRWGATTRICANLNS